jgi:hypothetical protein
MHLPKFARKSAVFARIARNKLGTPLAANVAVTMPLASQRMKLAATAARYRPAGRLLPMNIPETLSEVVIFPFRVSRLPRPVLPVPLSAGMLVSSG